MRKTKVKRPEKETATTAKEEGHDSSLSGAPSATTGDKGRRERGETYNNNTASERVTQEMNRHIQTMVICIDSETLYRQGDMTVPRAA